LNYPSIHWLEQFHDGLEYERVVTEALKNEKEVNAKMPTLGEYAKTYESKTTKNIAELPEVSTDLYLEDDEFEFEGKTIKQKVLNINNEIYRVPNSVIKQLRVHMEENPDLKKFKVNKKGTTKNDTEYTVIPLP